MRLYHSRHLIIIIPLLITIISGCSAPTVTQAVVNVQLNVDGQTIPVVLPPGSSVQQALAVANQELGSLDRIEPPLFSLLEDNSSIQIVRVTEKFEVEEEAIPF